MNVKITHIRRKGRKYKRRSEESRRKDRKKEKNSLIEPYVMEAECP
jgi:hypothetical protein